GKAFSPYIINVSTRTVPSEVFSRVMSDRGFCISSGSACNNNSRKKTEGLSELGFSASQAGTSIRVSFGCSTTIQQMEKLCTAMISVLKELS
ncbi:MAG: cysteine desulfurase, partial [Sphaerochaetaceae bacterium]